MTLTQQALSVLQTKDAIQKAKRSQEVANAWQTGDITEVGEIIAIDRPYRPEKPDLLPPSEMPKRTAGQSKEGRASLLHAIAHIELNAIDLAWDMVARFASHDGQVMPKAFFDDWVQIGYEEAKHFLLIEDRLKELDSFYGAFPAHDGLWESAQHTSENFAARLAIVPMVLEARGLDVTPTMEKNLRRNGDERSADIFKIIHDEEIGHVANGKKWFEWVSEKQEKEPRDYWQSLVEEYFRGVLKRPFNIDSRNKADFPSCWYEPIAG